MTTKGYQLRVIHPPVMADFVTIDEVIEYVIEKGLDPSACRVYEIAIQDDWWLPISQYLESQKQRRGTR